MIKFTIIDDTIHTENQTYNLSKLANFLGRNKILPRNCIYADEYQYVIEVPPKIQTLRTENQETSGWHLSMPWQYFIFRTVTRFFTPSISNIYLLWSLNKITKLDDKYLIPAILPNVSASGVVCLGTTVPSSLFSLS